MKQIAKDPGRRGGTSLAPCAEQVHHVLKFVHLHMRLEGITQRELSRASGVQKDTIRGWFSGRRDPSFANLTAVLAALGYDLKAVPLHPEEPAHDKGRRSPV